MRSDSLLERGWSSTKTVCQDNSLICDCVASIQRICEHLLASSCVTIQQEEGV